MWTWYDDYYHDDAGHWNDDNDEDKFFKLYDGYKNQKAQKASIKEKLLPIAWYPSMYCDWCVPEYKKKRQKNCGGI